ncbi:AraC family transcriptional regulator [Soonwooa sp.]|uniref:AraC family transcriptional regulator n=1 Tax=Soonwooa sp. TaxID=1938592 RepID=UPI0026257CF6|nr:AraC family transcriptional regulator [Soonwooa sp.]
MGFVNILTNEKIFEHLLIGHPYHPETPAFLMIRKGFIKIKAQFNILELKPNSLVLVDNNSVYELMEISEDIDIKILTYQREYIENIGLKFNKLNAYKTIRTEFREVYYSTPDEFDCLWRNAENMAYYIGILHQEEDYIDEILESFFAALIYQFANLIIKKRAISKEKMSRPQEIVLQFIKLVSDYYLVEKNVEFYAQKMMMSSRHLSSVLKEVTDRTAIQIIIDPE